MSACAEPADEDEVPEGTAVSVAAGVAPTATVGTRAADKLDPAEPAVEMGVGRAEGLVCRVGDGLGVRLAVGVEVGVGVGVGVGAARDTTDWVAALWAP